MKLRFTKMHGAGNDFVVLDGVTQEIEVNGKIARALADRRFGVGADQILLVEKPAANDIDFRYRIFNRDGGEVEQCGNGARCFVKFVHDHGLTDKRTIRVQTLGGIIAPRIGHDGMVSVDMGKPLFEPTSVPFDAGGLQPIAQGNDLLWPLEVDGVEQLLSVLSLGNPHAVQHVESVDSAPVVADGPRIEHHDRFPQRVNAGFMQVIEPHQIRLRVWERGAGETLACGSGACAAAVTGIRRGLLASPVTVVTPGGTLTVAWDGGDSAVVLSGPATTVFEGEVDIDALIAGR